MMRNGIHGLTAMLYLKMLTAAFGDGTKAIVLDREPQAGF